MLAGASVTTGFGTVLRMRDIVDAAIDDPIQIVDTANMRFYLDPVGYGNKAFAALKSESPDVLIGVDLLFWFGYGRKSYATRERQLQRALVCLAESDACAIVVGDIPTFTPGFMLPAYMIPTDGELKKLNEIIWSWAAGRANVRVLPLASLMQAMRKSQPVTVDGRKLVLSQRELLLLDGLHMSLKGSSLLAALALKELESGAGPLADRRVASDWDELYARVKKCRAAKIAKALSGKKGRPAVPDAENRTVEPRN